MPLLEDDLVDGMGARGCCIHIRLSDRPVLISLLQLPVDSIVTVDGSVLDLLDVNALLWIFTDPQTAFRSIDCLREQVLHLLVVDLDHGNRHLALDALSCIVPEFIDSPEDLFAGPRYDTFVFAVADNRIALS